MQPVSVDCVVMTAFKGIITLKPSVHGHSLDLNSSVIEGLINCMLDSVP